MVTSDDHAVKALDALRTQGTIPSYDWLKSEFGGAQISTELYHSLKYGRAILDSVDQLDQYLFSYSPMVARQWDFAFNYIQARLDGGDQRIIDYGCGQGLAGLLISDYSYQTLFADVRAVVAIEPSWVALRRAAAIYQALAPTASVSLINKGFSALTADDLTPSDGPTIHIFSNVLDIDGYDHVALLRKGLTKGKHTIIAVGHDRTIHGYSQGLQRVKDAVDTGAIKPGVAVHVSELKPFSCENRGEPAVLWLCKLDIDDE